MYATTLSVSLSYKYTYLVASDVITFTSPLKSHSWIIPLSQPVISLILISFLEGAGLNPCNNHFVGDHRTNVPSTTILVPFLTAVFISSVVSGWKV